jgi:hypothetical protein
VRSPIRVICAIRGRLLCSYFVFIRVHLSRRSLGEGRIRGCPEKIVRILLDARGANQIQAHECAAGQARDREHAKTKRADRHRFCRAVRSIEQKETKLTKTFPESASKVHRLLPWRAVALAEAAKTMPGESPEAQVFGGAGRSVANALRTTRSTSICRRANEQRVPPLPGNEFSLRKNRKNFA